MAKKLTCPKCGSDKLEPCENESYEKRMVCLKCNSLLLPCAYPPCKEWFLPKREWVGQKYHKPICQARHANDRHYARRKKAMELLREKEKNSLDR